MRRLILTGLIVAVATLVGVARAGYDPQRPTYDYNKYSPRDQDCINNDNPAADHGRCGPIDGPVFNSFINTPSYGDERSFFDGRLSTASTRSSDDPVTLPVGYRHDVTLRIYVDNDANEYAGYRTTSSDTLVRAELPRVSGRALRAVAVISADNAEPPAVYDSVDVVASTPFRLAYVPGTAVLLRGNRSYPLSDKLVTTGAPIGVTSMDGTLPAGFNTSALIELRVAVLPPLGGKTDVAQVVADVAILAVLLAIFAIGRTRRAVVAGTRRTVQMLRGDAVLNNVVAAVIFAAAVAVVALLIKFLIG
jgi:hypothetical protein